MQLGRLAMLLVLVCRPWEAGCRRSGGRGPMQGCGGVGPSRGIGALAERHRRNK